MKHTPRILLVVSFSSALLAFSSIGADPQAGAKTLKGEIVDLMCYIPNGAKGEGHKACAEKCIKGGGPVGLLVEDKVYLIVGEHKSINEQLAAKAAQTVTMTGKVSERSGLRLLSNAKLLE